MRVHTIISEREKKESALHRNSIGGYPILATTDKWPTCKLCHARMVFFFQMDIEKRFELPLKSGSHLCVFMCPQHNDSPSDSPGQHGAMPENYWTRTFGHYYVVLNHPRVEQKQFAEIEPHLIYQKVSFQEREEEIEWDGQVEHGTINFKVGGVPSWRDHPEFHTCSCGAEMIFLCEVPADYEFPKMPNAPDQPDNKKKNAYQLFLGHEIYIFACKNMCTSWSLWAVAQARVAESVL